MKIIFLDIDGVLIRFWNTKQIRDTRAKKWDKWGIITSLDEDLVINLREIIIKTWARIVISSSWRRNKELMMKLENQFYQCVLPDIFLSKNLWEQTIWKTEHSLWHWRWNEILSWIMKYNKTCKEWYHIKEWIAIDDDSFDMKCISRIWKFVKTETHEWLTKEKAEEIILKLNS